MGVSSSKQRCKTKDCGAEADLNGLCIECTRKFECHFVGVFSKCKIVSMPEKYACNIHLCNAKNCKNPVLYISSSIENLKYTMSRYCRDHS